MPAGLSMILGEHTLNIPHASAASDSADGRTAQFVAYRDLRIKSVFWAPLNTAQATKGTATTSASYRRVAVYNGGTSGSAVGTLIGSLNITASIASHGFRAFSTIDTTVTVAASSLVFFSHTTVGAATAQGTELQAGSFTVTYESV